MEFHVDLPPSEIGSAALRIAVATMIVGKVDLLIIISSAAAQLAMSLGSFPADLTDVSNVRNGAASDHGRHVFVAAGTSSMVMRNIIGSLHGHVRWRKSPCQSRSSLARPLYHSDICINANDHYESAVRSSDCLRHAGLSTPEDHLEASIGLSQRMNAMKRNTNTSDIHSYLSQGAALVEHGR